MQRFVCGSALFVSVLSAGCVHLGAADFVKAENSGNSGDRMLFSEVKDGKVVPSKSDMPNLAPDPDLEAAQGTHCKAPTEDGEIKPSGLVAAGFAPILAALAQVGVGQYFDRQKQRVEEIVAAAQASYSVTTEVSPEQLFRMHCLLVQRYTPHKEKVEQVGLQMLLRVQRIDGGFPKGTGVVVVRPVFIQVRNAVAATREAEQPSIGVAAALSLKAIGRRQGDDVLHLLPVGEVVISVGDVQLAGAPVCTDLSCQRSGWLTFPIDRGLLSLSVAIAEQGQTGFDDKLALAEIAALKEALGPAVAEIVKTRLSD